METTGKQFVEFWGWAAQKKVMNENTANSFASPVRQIMGVLENWETLDVSKMDVDDLFIRFRNARGKDFKPDSLNTYYRRFKQALDLFLLYVNDPTGWKFKGQPKSANRKLKPAKTAKGHEAPSEHVFEMPIAQSEHSIQMVDYPYPLRNDCLVRLRLPIDLKASEVERLAVFMRTLARDSGS